MNLLDKLSNRRFRRFGAKIALCASILATYACSTPPKTIVLPPEIVKVPVFVPLPPECGLLGKVELPPGSTAMDVMKKQHAAILAYEVQVKTCFK